MPPPPPAPPADTQYAPPPPVAASYGAPVPMGPGPIGKVRSTGLSILLYIVTLTIYGLVWWYQTHEEMKRHTGRGLGGLLALLIGFFIAPVMLFLTPSEVGQMQELGGREKTVSALTGLWILLPIAGPIVWFVKTNGALNDYWRSMGAPA